MPELPEVETIKNVLLPIVKNKTITKIDVLRKQTILGDAKEFKHALEGKTFLNVSRIGKYLIFHLSSDMVFISHLRMEGKYYEVDEKDENTKYSRVVFHLSDNKKLCYDDSRCFGIMKLSNESKYKNEEEIAKLGPEPFQINDVSILMKKCKNKSLPIKTTLLDQTLITGLGNIYVDETLYQSKIHPLTPAKRVTKTEWINVINNAQEILNTAIKLGGSTIKSYHPGKGIDGNFQTRIKIYGKKGEACPICGATYRFIKVNGRGTTYCPKCQIKKADRLFVAITGKIASGKSLATKQFNLRGYSTIDSDEIVKNLYLKEEVKIKLEKTLHISLGKSSSVDKTLLRNHLLIHPKDKKKVESLIHPLVKKEIIDFLKTSNSKIAVAEIPLLFESKMDSLFDVIIAIDINSTLQDSRLYKRNGKTGELNKEINKNNLFDINKNKADFLVENNSAEDCFKKKINQIIDKLEDRLD